MEIKFYFDQNLSKVFVRNFFTWHDSRTVVVCDFLLAIWYSWMELQHDFSIVTELPRKGR